MSDFEDIQRLLRLKRYEKPSEDFVEDFVRQFQHRQRQELLRHSARGLLWERVNTYFEGLFAPKWRWAGATAVALVTVLVVFKPAASVKGGSTATDHLAARGFNYNDKQAPISDAEVERYLISRHFQGGLGNELTPVGGSGSDAFRQQEPSLKQDLLAR
jgi:hypothetical protein